MHGTAQPRFPGDEGHIQILCCSQEWPKGWALGEQASSGLLGTDLKDMRVMSSEKS